ncbi:MAG: FtsW/RodA/SpoVE family cell cycle protein [Bacteroidota bacterium]
MDSWKQISESLNLQNAEGNALTLKPNTKGDKVIWSIVAMLVLISLLAVYSSTGSLAYKHNRGNVEYYLFRQVTFIVIGVAIIYFTHLLDYRWFSKVALWFYIISIPLLIYTLFFGSNINDANRWIRLPVINLTFQTSDFARLALFMYLARQLSRKQTIIKDFKKGYLPLVLPIVLTCILIAPANLSTALLTGSTGMLVIFLGRASTKHLLLTALVALLPVALLVTIALKSYHPEDSDTQVKRSGVTSSLKQQGRIGTWMSRIQDFVYAKGDDVPYQIQQAKIAIAKGGWFGTGPGNSEQRNFLPHPYSDFIYAIIIEEYGMMGGMVIVFLYMAFLYRSIKLFRNCPFAFGAFLALALSITLAIQAISNMAVNVNIFPVTGVTLPLVSMGGTSFLFTCFAIGIILSVARNVEKIEAPVVDKVPASDE